MDDDNLLDLLGGWSDHSDLGMLTDENFLQVLLNFSGTNLPFAALLVFLLTIAIDFSKLLDSFLEIVQMSEMNREAAKVDESSDDSAEKFAMFLVTTLLVVMS